MRPPQCPICTGVRPFCIHRSYPLPRDFNMKKMIEEKLSKDYQGPSYSVFVGRFGLPNVYVGPMVGLEEKGDLDNPSAWFGQDYTKIIEMRSLLLRSKKRESIFSKSRFVQDVQELAMSYRPTDVEMSFKSKPVYRFTLSEFYQPMGPAGSLEKMQVTENVKIKTQVERVISDELKASESSFMLYRAGLNVYKISSIFSSGALGLEKNKKLVPSRYSVTAIDDIIAKQMMTNIRTYPPVSDCMVFESHYLDNHFVILLMPGKWEFENFEAWAPGSNWSYFTKSKIAEEYEPFDGRTTYADKQAGGYYASRIGVCEGLEAMRKQARVVVFREVGEGYSIPMGVWVVRETARNAFKQPYKKFSTRQEAMDYVNSRLRIPLSEYVKQSRILGQKTLADF